MGHRRGSGLRQIKTPAAKSLYKSIFYITTFGIAFYQLNLSTVLSISWVVGLGYIQGVRIQRLDIGYCSVTKKGFLQ